MKRTPGEIVIRYGIVMIVLTLLQTLLIISNNVHYLGYWESPKSPHSTAMPTNRPV